MKRYPRFHRDTSRSPTLFFVALFILGTVVLGGMFVFGNKSNKLPVTNYQPQITTAAPQEIAALPVMNVDEYRTVVTGAFTVFRDTVTAAAGDWIDAPTWDARMRDAATLKALDRAVATLRATLVETRVPGPARQTHLLMVVATEDLLDAVRNDRVDAVEGLLLRLQELINLP